MASRPFKRICASGYFDPLHVGHCDYLKNAKSLGDILIVIVNNDKQKTHIRTPEHERKKIIESIRYVDEAVISSDESDSVCDTLKSLHPDVFAKGVCPSQSETELCKEMGIEIVTNVGSDIHMHDILHQFR